MNPEAQRIAISEPEQHVVELESACCTIVYQVTKDNDDGVPYAINFKLYPVLGAGTIEDERPKLVGLVRSDGCSDWRTHDWGSIHFCGHRYMVNLMNAISACYHIAGKYMPEANVKGQP